MFRCAVTLDPASPISPRCRLYAPLRMRVRYGVFLLRMLAFAAVLGSPMHAHAEGGSYNVDDASVVGAGKCQLESWLREWSHGSNGFYAVPACGAGPVEFGVTLNTGHGTAGPGINPSIKWQLRNGDDKGVGVAVATAATWLHGRRDDAQAYVATTFGIDDARRWMVALNAGADRIRGESAYALYGVGLDFSLTTRWTLLVERMWTHRTITSQGGVRLNFGDSSLDLVVGSERSPHAEHWINIGWNAAF